MNNRIVRDTCIAFATATTSRLERAALMAIAFLAERDESDECVALRPKVDDMDDADRDRFLDRTMDRYMERAMGAQASPPAPKPGTEK